MSFSFIRCVKKEMQKLSQTREKKIMLRFLRSPKIRVLRARHPARRGNTRFKGTFGCTNSDSKQSRPLNELSRAQKFFERRYSRDIFRISEANVSSGDGDTNRAIASARALRKNKQTRDPTSMRTSVVCGRGGNRGSN